jgi:hypothetical protein
VAKDGRVSARLADGAIVDEIDVDGIGTLPVRFSRCEAGWQAAFELDDPAISDLAVVHRLVAPTLREARAMVPQAASFLLGRPVDVSLPY